MTDVAKVAAGLTKALDAIENVRAANAGNFKREGKEWAAYDQACRDCHAAVRAHIKDNEHG